MNTKTIIFLCCSSLLLLAEAAERQPNVLMVVIDDLADYTLETPRLNQVKTPNLDRFESTALLFTKACCTAPLCNPSRTSVISGIAPHRSGVTDNRTRWVKTPMLMDCVGFPELFKHNGYKTMWWGKLWHGTSTPAEERLDEWRDEYTRHGNREGFGPASDEFAARLEGITHVKSSSQFGALDVPDDKWQDTRVANVAVERLSQKHDKPFLMVTGLVRPHAPFTAPTHFFDLYERDKIELPPWKEDDWNDIPGAADAMVRHQYDWEKFKATGLWKDVLHSYMAGISFMDWNLGRILDALDASEYADNTIVILWSDHGFHMGEKSCFAKSALWEQTTHVPLMIRTPEMNKKNLQCGEVVSLLDIYPTLVDLCGLKGVPEGQLDGRSLLPLVSGQEKWQKDVALTSYEQGNHTVRNDRFRYIRYNDGSEELYDIENDPNEWVNLANNPKHESVRAELAEALAEKVGGSGAVLEAGSERSRLSKSVENRSSKTAEKTQQVLNRLDLSKIKGIDFVSGQSPERSAAALLKYYKCRTTVKHPAVSNELVVSDRDLKWADDALEHIFVGQPNYPSFFCGKDIDWSMSPVPDKEWRVQLHRMYFWTAMSKVYSATGNEEYAREWSEQLVHWIKNNPRDKAHFYAWRTLEAGKRGHSWTELFFRFIDSPHFTEETLVYFLSSMHEHASFLLNAEYNSRSNWALMQAEGLAFIGFAFPEFNDAEKWKTEGIRRLQEAIALQVYPDGQQRELCMGYHVGSIGWLTRTLSMAEVNGLGALFAPSYHEQVEKMCEVPMKLCLPNGTNVQFGDTTKAGVPGQYTEQFKRWAESYGRSDFLFMATSGKQGTAPETTAFALPESGLYSMRSGWNQDAICLVLKCGPDGGYHCQPDNGSFDVYAGGRNLMPDSGSYTYSKEPEMKKWRSWFRQTKVHQTLTLNGANSRYAAKQLSWKPGENLDVLSVENKSYKNMTHRRTICFVDKRYFVIIDEATGSATGDIDIHFQLAPGKTVFTQSDFSVRSDFKDGWNVLVKTRKQPGLELANEKGWVSYAYTQKEKRPAFRYRLKKKTADQSIRFVTVVAPYNGAVPDIEVAAVHREGKTFELELRENGLLKHIELAD